MSKNQLQTKIKEANFVKIELGCGENKRDVESIGIDLLPLKGVDFVANIEEGLPFLDDRSVDEISSVHVLEHIENFEFLMKEIHRVLKLKGKKKIKVPHFSNPYYYSDYTHKRFFGLYSFDYLGSNTTMLKRKVPNFYSDIRFRVIDRKLIFKNPPYFVRHNFGRFVLQKVFNLNAFMQELYESNFCYIFPCTELEFVLEAEV